MKQQLLDKFRELFGDTENVTTYFAPGRVNLIGEHTDYNGGHVFPCALTIGTYAAVRKRTDRKLNFYSINLDKYGLVQTSLDDLTPSDAAGWTNYPKGVIWAFEKRGCKLDFGFDMVIVGDIPNGSGLSSSASLEVLTGFILRDLYGFDDITNINLAQIGQYSENNYNGCNCGIMDQFASSMGKENNAIFLDCSTLEYEYAPIILEDAKVIVTNSKVKHSLVDSAYNERRSSCEKAVEELKTVVDITTLGDLTEAQFEEYKSAIKDETRVRRAKHAVYENQRTIKAVSALRSGDLTTFGKLMNESHISLRDDYETSCPECDILAETAWTIDGVIGSRITGGGFGGCTVSIVKNDAIDTFKNVVGSTYKEKTGIDAEFYVVSIGNGPSKI